MCSSRVLRTLAGIAALVAIAVAAGYAQSRTAPPEDPVVAEIRALRADLNDRLEATMRAQLLIARLQVQEQRINTVVRQLHEVEAKLRDNAASKEQAEHGMKVLGAMGMKLDDNEQGTNIIFGPLKAGVERIEKTEAELKLQQTELTGMLGDEQARWVAFNAKLEELERLFDKPRPAR
jgi:hypothetical protein